MLQSVKVNAQTTKPSGTPPPFPTHFFGGGYPPHPPSNTGNFQHAPTRDKKEPPQFPTRPTRRQGASPVEFPPREGIVEGNPYHVRVSWVNYDFFPAIVVVAKYVFEQIDHSQCSFVIVGAIPKRLQFEVSSSLSDSLSSSSSRYLVVISFVILGKKFKI